MVGPSFMPCEHAPTDETGDGRRTTRRSMDAASRGDTGTHRLPSPLAAGAWIVEIQGPDVARCLALDARAVVVGSSASADVVVDDRAVSGRHCELQVTSDGLRVRDLGSTNGTFVGGARVGQALAQRGTVIVIGRSSIVVMAREPARASSERGAPLPGIAGSSTVMLELAAQVRRLAKLRSPVLVTGESGVGKELVVRALHAEGPRARGPFVPMNVASLPRELVESELFGHERGAFTGAVARKTGAFMEAEGGTLFLDEIGELPLDAQPKLLRALDGYEVRRVGSSGGGRRADVRVVAATLASLPECVLRGTFRRDLFHRLEVFVIEVPPLRARPGDIPAIARTLLANLQPEIGRRELTSSAVARLMAHPWEGNVREFRNVLQRAADLAGDDRLLDAPVFERVLRRRPDVDALVSAEMAREALERCQGNVSKAAREVALPRTSFRKLIARGRGPVKTTLADGQLERDVARRTKS